MELGIERVDGHQKKLRHYKSQLQQAYQDLKSDHTETSAAT
jgi:hypothetical protein